MKQLRDLTLRIVPVVHPSTSLAEVIELLEEEPLKIVVIVGDEQYMGVYTPDDEYSGRIPAGADREELSVGPYASGLRFVGAPEMTVVEAKERMVRHGLAVMPVVANRIYKGVVTLEDLNI